MTRRAAVGIDFISHLSELFDSSNGGVNAGPLSRLNAWPVVQRELREGARRRVNHVLRLFSALVGMGLLWLVLDRVEASASQTGAVLFVLLHSFVLVLILLTVPALTADCLSREKREGTLGLLFLTPLTAGGIVTGKMLTHALRAFCLWLAILPILTIPFILGGTNWFDVGTAISFEFCFLTLCLAAGLRASCFVRRRNAALVLAYIFGALLVVGFGETFYMVLIRASGISTTSPFLGIFELIAMLSGLLQPDSPGWKASMVMGGFPVRLWLWLCLASPLATLLVFLFVAQGAARQIERSWQDKSPSIRREKLSRRYCTPVFGRWFQRLSQRTLDRNPIAWLQQYSWKARMSKWGLCLAFIIVELAVSAPTDTDELFGLTQVALLFILAGMSTFAGVGGFLEEKRSGALELLLISPLPVNSLIFGRVWGLWKQFLPAGLVLLGSILSREWMRGRFSDDYADDRHLTMLVVTCGFFALPIFATYFALRVKNLFVAAILTWITLCFPNAFALVFAESFSTGNSAVFFAPLVILVCCYLPFVWLVYFLLRHSLSRRIYSF